MVFLCPRMATVPVLTVVLCAISCTGNKQAESGPIPDMADKLETSQDQRIRNKEQTIRSLHAEISQIHSVLTGLSTSTKTLLARELEMGKEDSCVAANPAEAMKGECKTVLQLGEGRVLGDYLGTQDNVRDCR